MYFELKDWVFNRGGRLMYLGGNGLNYEVEFVDESTMVVHEPEGGCVVSLRVSDALSTITANVVRRFLR